jgi:NCS1 family nucleobase:cation symporter-1
MCDYCLGGRSDPARIPELYDRSRVLDWGFVAWAGGVGAVLYLLTYRLGPLWVRSVSGGAAVANETSESVP